jgi:hypothetical protein
VASFTVPCYDPPQRRPRSTSSGRTPSPPARTSCWWRPRWLGLRSAYVNALAPDQVWNDTYNTSLQEVFYGDAGPNPLATGGGKPSVFSRPWYQNGGAESSGAAAACRTSR